MALLPASRHAAFADSRVHRRRQLLGVPTWGEILAELDASVAGNGGRRDYDGVRQKYLQQLHGLTRRNVIVYYSDWLNGGGPGIVLADMQGMMEACKGLKGPLDLILHSPGGSAEATASIVRYLRQKFDDIRVFVPLAAMSAATMWALAGDRIVMGKHSQLGPIDPQLMTPQGPIPARAIIDQFEMAKAECARDPRVISAWLPVLQQYGPVLIKQCETADRLARRLVREWLRAYMLRADPDRIDLSGKIARYFADHGRHQSHALGIDREAAMSKGVVIDLLEADQALQDAVLSVHHATLHTYAGGAVKIIENHLGKAFVQHQGLMPMPGLPVLAPPVPTGP